MLSSLFARLSQRKLFITGSIVAIRNFASHANEYSGALKQFYFAVHPDFFGQHPFEKETNENSLKVLNDFMSEVNARHDVKPTTVHFFLRKKANVSVGFEQRNNSNRNFNRVEIQLNSKHLPTLIYKILSCCSLPIKADLENLVKSQKDQNRGSSTIQWSSSLRGLMDEDVIQTEPPKTAMDTLYTWLATNIESSRVRAEEVRPLFEENRRISRRIIRRHRLKGFVASDSAYSQIALNGALKQLEFLFKRRTVNTRDLNGKTLKIGHFNGLDHLGRFIVDIADVPTAWIQAVVSLADLDGLLPVLDLEEMQISEILWGLRISRGRKQDPVPIKLYYKQVSKLLQNIRETFDQDTMVSLLLGKFRGRIVRASDNLCINDEGTVVIPCMATFDALSSFLRLNYSQIIEARKSHARSLQAEHHSIETCTEKLQLSNLSKDQIVTSEQMSKSCERLKRAKLLGLEHMQLIISNYYAISGDGEIRIPWNWKQ